MLRHALRLVPILLTTLLFSQTPEPIRVTRIFNITDSTAIDNRSATVRQNNYHTFCAIGTGSWSVQMQYSDDGSTWDNFGTGSSVEASSESCVGTGVGYHEWIRFDVTGSASITYAAVKNFFPSAGATGAGSGEGAPTNATFITQTANASLSAEQSLASLSTGILKNTTSTGVLSIAASGTDYELPLTFSGPLSRATNTISCPTCVTSGGTYSDPSWITALDYSKLTGVPSGFTPSAHATSHISGADQVATTTPGAGLIPKADGSGTIPDGWLPAGISRDSESPATGDIGGSLSSGYTIEDNAVQPDDLDQDSSIGGGFYVRISPSDTAKFDYRTTDQARADLQAAPLSHSDRHKDGGEDEVASGTPGANLIPKADTNGTLNQWLDRYAGITDGTNTAIPSGYTGNFKVRSSDSSITVTAGNDDATHGDNLNLVVNQSGLTLDSIGGTLSASKIDAAIARDSEVTTLLSGYQLLSAKNAVSGYAGLDGSGLMDRAQIPDMTGDSGSGGENGGVPAPGIGDAGNCLKGNATWGPCGGGTAVPNTPKSFTDATSVSFSYVEHGIASKNIDIACFDDSSPARRFYPEVTVDPGTYEAIASWGTTNRTGYCFTLGSGGGDVRTGTENIFTADGGLTLDNGKGIRFRELTTNGTDYVEIKGDDSYSATVTLKWGVTGECTGTNGGKLTVNASGVIVCSDDN